MPLDQTGRTAYSELLTYLREAATLGSCAGVLGWDEQTYLPEGGAEHRANQTALLAGLHHDRLTDPRIGDWLAVIEEQIPDVPETPEDRAVAANIRETRRQFDRNARMPKRLVEELTRLGTLSQQAWVKARKHNSFAEFQPWLDKMISLKREQAAALKTDEHAALYDVLLDEYEPGASSADIAAAFAPLRTELVALLDEIRSSGRTPDRSIVHRNFPIETQRQFSQRVAAEIGFDFDRGRIDESAHPFCTSLGPGDCRLTTRYDENFFNSAFFGTLHEAGHGIYEQGLPADAYGTPLGDTVSLGIHESQSRMWENFVGRSRSFWQHYFPPLKEAFPQALADVDADAFYFAVNDVQPSFIRVEADEVTYNLHIMLRFGLEQAIISGELSAADVAAEWDRRFTADFGITPPDAAHGALQDVHWSAGLIGYFPTYALGNMYAAQFFAAAQAEIGPLDEQFARGEFAPLKQWLNRNIHAHGMQYRAADLVQKVTGQPLSPTALIAHLRQKLTPLYTPNN